jgi:poly(hydroxyalkanoate) depolymerase family esterase
MSTRAGKCATAVAATLCLLTAVVADAGVRYYKTVDERPVLIVVPDGGTESLPLVVALHGCRQSAEEFLAATRLEALADREGFVLALPETRTGPGNPLGCWQWWMAAQQRRDGEEPRLMADTVDAMDVDIDPARVYALGLSSGGAMAAILAVVYPDVFAAVGIHSGIGFAAAANVPCALDIMTDGPGRPEERGTLGYLHQTTHRIVPTMIIHGSDDETVDPSHADALVREIAQRDDWLDNDRDDDSFDADPDARVDNPGPCDDDCLTHTLRRFEDRDGNVMLESVVIDGLGHAWSGGAAGHDYADPRGPDAGALFWSFFRGHRLNPDTLHSAGPHACRDQWGAPWWHLTWGGTMSLAEYTCNMNPWSMVWRHEIEGIHGPGRCPGTVGAD